MLQNQQVLLFIILLSVIRLFGLNAQSIDLNYSGSDSWFLTERSNWSTYVNGLYKGLTHREIHSRITSGKLTSQGREYNGNFYKLTEMNHDSRNISLPVESIFESKFTVSQNGYTTFSIDQGYPEYRNFPIFPDEPVTMGSSWVATGVRCIDPKNNGRVSDLQILVEYRLSGQGLLNGEEVWKIDFKFATRFPGSYKPTRIDIDLTAAAGTHEGQIILRKGDGAVLVIMDRLDETFTFKDGNSLRYKGNTAIFASSIARTEDLFLSLQNAASGSEQQPDSAKEQERIAPSENGIVGNNLPEEREPLTSVKDDGTDQAWETENTPQGVRISVRNIRFVADKDEILPDENTRLDSIAQVLLSVPNGHFLVEGHTASTGKPLGEGELSIARAKRIIEELCDRGLRAEQFIFRGLGSTIPIGDNATEAGRALNRRVEITVLN